MSATYQAKVQNAYVSGAYMGLNLIEFSKNVKRAKYLEQKQLDFVLSWFPDAEVRKFNVTMEHEW